MPKFAMEIIIFTGQVVEFPLDEACNFHKTWPAFPQDVTLDLHA